MPYLLSVIFVLGLSACSASFEPLAGCEDNAALSVHCGFQNPEDLALTPDGQFLIVSEFGGMSPLAPMQAGQLSLFDITSLSKHSLPISFAENTWGEPSCSRTADTPMGPHGIDVVQRSDGRWQLAVVSHVPYESIEMFELVNNGQWALEWKGCVKAEGLYYFNDVALTPQGKVFATHMFDKGTSILSVVWYVFSKATSGSVVAWSQAQGFEALEFTAGSFPNGIAFDAAGRRLVVNYNTGDETLLYDLASQQVIGRYVHNSPDNVVIKDGVVWVANHDHAATETFRCEGQVNCPLPFSINQLSLDDLSLLKSYPFDGSNMGVGTVGVPHEGTLWIGSYHADRLGRASLK